MHCPNRFSLFRCSAPFASAIFCLCAPQIPQAAELDRCVQERLANADDTVTVGELRRQCQHLNNEAGGKGSQTKKPGAVEKRMAEERKNVARAFSIMPHRPNFILPLAYNGDGYNAEHHRASNGDSAYDFDPVEAQFQISIKSPLAVGLFDNTMDIYAAYTNHSFWQVYNNDISAPFRETNHEPEAWIQFNPGWDFIGIVNTSNLFGINHQSNGQSGELSRSWNRLFATFIFEIGDLGLSFTPWYRIPESEHDDDNPDITRYMGHYEIGAIYKWNEHTVSLMTRNAFESDFRRGSVQVSWSFPLGNWPFLKGYIQYFNGYGESLIDYDQHVNRVGLGLALSDWL